MKRPFEVLIVLLALTVSSCGGGGVRGEPPLVTISGFSIENNGLRARVDIHNPNDVDLEVASISMTLKIDVAELPQSRQSLDFVIHPHGTEQVEVTFQPDNATREALENPQGGGRGFTYSARGEVRDRQGGSESFEHDGYFYPVPGRPGEFRGAGTQR